MHLNSGCDFPTFLKILQNLFDEGNFNAAKRLLDGRLLLDRRDEILILKVAHGNIQIETNEYEVAINIFLELIDEYADDPMVYVNLIGAYLRGGRQIAAKSLCKIAIVKFPDHGEIRKIFAAINNFDFGQTHFTGVAPKNENKDRIYAMDIYDAWEKNIKTHAGGVFSNYALRKIEEYLPEKIANSVETGCGKTTVLFSILSDSHLAFTLDDRELGDQSSVGFFEKCPISNVDRVKFIYGPTQKTLPSFVHKEKFDVALIDGPHGYPFPEMEYMYLYPHLNPGGVLILDDVAIPTIGRLADFISEDDMFEPVGLVECTAIFKRTDSPTFDPFGDGWWNQKYNRRRVSPARDIYLGDSEPIERYSSLNLDRLIHPVKVQT